MGIGAFDKLDVALVKKYNSLRADNPIVGDSMINPDKMYEAMNDYANINMTMINIQRNLKEKCINAIAPNIHYTKTKQLKPSVT